MFNVQMNSGSILSKEKIGKLTEFIIYKLAEEKLSVEESKIILEHVKDLVGEYSLVQTYKPLSNIFCSE